MNLSALINLHHLAEENIIAFTGSGGKTTLMYQISRELSVAGKRSITTTTTHIAIPGPDESPCWMLLKDNYEHCRQFWEKQEGRDYRLTLGWELDETGGKLTGLPLDMIPRISAWSAFDHLLIEADGSRGKSLKGYRPGEPVLPQEEHCTLVILGMDVMNKPINEVHVHRPEIVKAHLSAHTADSTSPGRETARQDPMTVNVRHLEAMLFHPEGYLAKAGPGRKILVLNKIENPVQYCAALELYHRVSLYGIPVVFRGPLWGYEKDSYYTLESPPGENP